MEKLFDVVAVEMATHKIGLMAEKKTANVELTGRAAPPLDEKNHAIPRSG